MDNRYVYSTIRFVPNPASGEFVNIGAIVGSEESGEWELRTVENPKRARQLDVNGILDKVFYVTNNIAKDIDLFVDSAEELTPSDLEINEAWLNRLYDDSQNVIQFSQPTPLLAAEFDEAMSIVFDQLIIDPAINKRSKSKTLAIQSIKQAYIKSNLSLGKNLFNKASFKTQKYAGHLDFAVANGKALQLTQAWSFEVQSPEDLSEHVKSWAWTIHDLRRNGGIIETNQRTIDIPKGVEIGVVCIPPKIGEDDRYFSEAKEAFEEIEAKIYEYGQDYPFVDKAAELLFRS